MDHCAGGNDVLSSVDSPSARVASLELSFGTQSNGGSRFVERLLTIIETCRRRSRDAFAWLTTAVEAKSAGKPAPSLAEA
jgi:hypothetical protein